MFINRIVKNFVKKRDKLNQKKKRASRHLGSGVWNKFFIKIVIHNWKSFNLIRRDIDQQADEVKVISDFETKNNNKKRQKVKTKVTLRHLFFQFFLIIIIIVIIVFIWFFTTIPTTAAAATFFLTLTTITGHLLD